jgi:hypothetical protein
MHANAVRGPRSIPSLNRVHDRSVLCERGAPTVLADAAHRMQKHNRRFHEAVYLCSHKVIDCGAHGRTRRLVELLAFASLFRA